jgi:hypothetical protein
MGFCGHALQACGPREPRPAMASDPKAYMTELLLTTDHRPRTTVFR